MRVGTPVTASPPAGPNSASGRLLPVDVNPGTRQSLTVFHHLDGHRPHELRLALVERCPMDQFAHRAHHALRLPRLEELDHPQRRRSPAAPPAAAAGELERLFADEAALRVIEFFKTRQAEGVMRTERELIHRTPLDEREVKLVRAMAIEVVKYGERLARSRVHVDRQ